MIIMKSQKLTAALKKGGGEISGDLS